MEKNNDVIFICHGNVNRSRAAEEILKNLNPSLNIESFAVGIKSEPGRLMTKKIRTVFDENFEPYDSSIRSKILTLNNIKNAGRVFIMDNNNLKHYKLRFGEELIGKLEMLSLFINEPKIPDPGFSEGLTQFRETFNKIKSCCIELNKSYEKL